MKDDVLQAVIAGAKANGSWDARYGEVSIKEARSQTKGTQHMTRVEALEIIKLLSALESWSFSLKERLPDYLHDKIAASIEVLEKEVLK